MLVERLPQLGCNDRLPADVQLTRYNVKLMKKSPACLEYVLVQELVHLLELNNTPLSHEAWDY